VAQLAAALRTLLADPARRADLGAAARAAACSRFDLRDSVDRYRFLFRELGARRPGAAALVTGPGAPSR
jgi:glycosyltransferase involved in cell wall biosynthesis